LEDRDWDLIGIGSTDLPVLEHFKKIVSETTSKAKGFADGSTPSSDYFQPSFPQSIMRHYMLLVLLWSSIMLGRLCDVQALKSLSHLNMPVVITV